MRYGKGDWGHGAHRQCLLTYKERMVIFRTVKRSDNLGESNLELQSQNNKQKTPNPKHKTPNTKQSTREHLLLLYFKDHVKPTIAVGVVQLQEEEAEYFIFQFDLIIRKIIFTCVANPLFVADKKIVGDVFAYFHGGIVKAAATVYFNVIYIERIAEEFGQLC